jgi:hypothetical protein
VWVIPSKFIYGANFLDGLAVVAVEGNRTFLDSEGILVFGEAKYEIIHLNGKVILAFGATGVARSFSDELLAVKIKDKWGYLNMKGEFTITPQFDKAGSFSEGIACVELDEQSYCIDENGKKVFDMDFWDLDSFRNGLAMTTTRDETGEYLFGYIDKKGEVVWSPTR